MVQAILKFRSAARGHQLHDIWKFSSREGRSFKREHSLPLYCQVCSRQSILARLNLLKAPYTIQRHLTSEN